MCPSITESEESKLVVKESLSQPVLPLKSTTRFTRKFSKPPKIIKNSCNSILDTPQERPILVYYKGQELTPDPIKSIKFKYPNTKFDLEIDTPTATHKSERKSSQITRFSSSTRVSVYVKTKVSQASLTNLIADKNLANFTDTEEYQESEGEQVPSAMCLPAESCKIVFPDKIKLVLEETDTITLFELPSKTVTKGTQEAEAVEKQNEIYEYLTVGKGKNRKKISTEAQTVEQILKTRHTNAPRTDRQNNYAFASVWDMFDSYQQEKPGDGLLLDGTEEMVALNKLYESDKASVKVEPDNDQVKITLDINKLLDAACIMERVLANNNFKIQQENYKGLLRFETGPLLCESFNYILKSLWTFSYYKIENRPVTVVNVNPKNTDIIGVGYGKYKYTENLSGVVCIWNIKNSTQPERYYEFETSVMSMAFSNGNPNLLAVGFYNGDICILDIISYEKVVLARSCRKTSPSYRPVWQVKWYYDNEMDKNTEKVMAINIDGRVDTFTQTKTKDFICYPLIKLMRIDDSSQTMLGETKCHQMENEIPLFKTANCQIHCWHPTLTDVYFIGTSGGCIYRCSTNYLKNYINMFRAHRGPINGMEFSKFCRDIFVTCGADWTVKIWKENIFIPLIVLMTDMNPVMDVKFSPTHSTLIAAVTGSEIYLWNIKQKVDTASLLLNLAPKFGRLTMIHFTNNGKNLITADVNGKVHMRYLLGLFPPASSQGKILEQAIQNNLIIQPDLLAHIERKKKLHKFL